LKNNLKLGSFLSWEFALGKKSGGSLALLTIILLFFDFGWLRLCLN
jgi:hypothetical protein